MRWDYPPLDINPAFPGLGEIFIIIIIIIIVIIIIIIIIIIIQVLDFSWVEVRESGSKDAYTGKSQTLVTQYENLKP